MNGSVRIIANAGSGRKEADRLADLIAPLASAWGTPPDLRIIRDGRQIPDEAARARADGVGTVIAAGGDGTLSGVAAALAGSDIRMGVLPMGTFNFFARSLNIPLDPKEAIAALIDGVPTPVSVGEVNGRVFLNNASIGLYPAILSERESIYRRWGRSQMAAYWSVLRTLASFRRPSRMRVTVDGETRRLRTPMVFVANSAYQLDQYGLHGAEMIRDGRFAVFVAPDTTRLQLLAFALRLALKSAQPERDFELLDGRDVLIETTRRRRTIARDGERERIEGPFRFRLRQNALQVILPPAERKVA